MHYNNIIIKVYLGTGDRAWLDNIRCMGRVESSEFRVTKSQCESRENRHDPIIVQLSHEI